MWSETAVSWLLTLALHAGVLLTAAWAIDRGWLREHPGWRELLWRTALFGGLLTASAQALLAPPTAARFALSNGAAPVVVTSVGRVNVPALQAPSARTSGAGIRATTGVPATTTVPAMNAYEAAPAPVWRPSWQTVVVAAWLAGALLMLARLVAAWLRLERLLAQGSPLPRETAVTDAAALAIQARIAVPRLSALDELASPVAAVGGRIVLPGWALGLLEREQVRAMLAHETAHLARRDPAWKLAMAAAAAVLWFLLPLTAIARRRLDELAELACDAWAAIHLGNGRSLAECLAECAERHAGGVDLELAPAMAHRDSPLMQRIGYLIDGYRPQTAISRVRAGAAVALAVAVAAAVLPGFGPRRAVAQVPPSPPSPPAAPATPPAPPPPPPYGEQSHIHSAGGVPSKKSEHVRVTSRDEDHGYSADIKGKIAFNEQYDDVVSLEDDGYANFSETQNGVERRVEYKSRGGKIERRYFVNDREQPLDAAAQAWVAKLMARVVRDSAIDAEARVKRLYASGGAKAVLDEIEHVDSSYARGVYLKQLFAQGKLSPAETTRVLGAIDRIDSDYERRNALSALAAAGPLDVAQQKLVLAQAEKIGSDYERAELLIGMLPKLAADADLRRSWLHAAEAIGSDYEKRRCLNTFLDDVPADDATLAAIVASANSIGSDYERRELLVATVGRVGDGEHLAPLYAQAVGGIGSDYERREALLALIRAPNFGASATRAVLETASGIGSDHECSEVLVALARVMPKDAGLIERYRSVARRLSDVERGAAERALDRFAS